MWVEMASVNFALLIILNCSTVRTQGDVDCSRKQHDEALTSIRKSQSNAEHESERQNTGKIILFNLFSNFKHLFSEQILIETCLSGIGYLKVMDLLLMRELSLTKDFYVL
ncbi:hypothetical protein KP509_05G082300 [Ceratopteris richardii]|uniref:Secreted protein n=1 Tax=Ceratopteris richardii TaxID=49495 RepID=A0A8T2V059_CERRI|nr:hypothetical protein KP509_05G082300 [Ceratopteris richardii]